MGPPNGDSRFRSLIRRASGDRGIWLRAAAWSLVLISAGVLGNASWPRISDEYSAWRLERQLEAMPIPQGWTRSNVQRVQMEDGPWIVAAYRVPVDGASEVRRAADALILDGWMLSGGAPDLSTVVLQRDDLEVGIGTIGLETPIVRVELRNRPE